MGSEGTYTGTLSVLKDWKETLLRLWAQALQSILNAQKLLLARNSKNKKKGSFHPFSLDERVWLEGTNLRLAYPSIRLAPKRYDPFPITKVISPVIYWLDLLPSWKIFPTFHTSLLSPYCETSKHETNYLELSPDVIDGEEEYKAKEVLDQQVYGWGKKKQNLIKWKGYSLAHNSWEDAAGAHPLDLVKKFLKSYPQHIHIMDIKARVWPHHSAMPSASSAPTLPSPELYSLDHYLWYDGLMCMTPSP